MASRELDHFSTFGGVYDALDAFEELDAILGRLRRGQALDDQEWTQSRRCMDSMRARLEEQIDSAA